MSAMMKKPECIFDGADNKKDLKEEDNLFSIVAAKNYGIMVLPVPSEPMFSYKLSITTQYFFIFFIDLKKGILPTTRELWKKELLFEDQQRRKI